MDSSVMDANKTDTSTPSDNPIDGIAAPTVIVNNVYFEGPAWAVDGLYVSGYTTGNIIKFTPSMPVSASNPAEIRPVVTAATIPIGNCLDEKTNMLVSLEVNDGTQGGMVIRTPLTGAAPRTGTAIAGNFDGGSMMFDSPNDCVVRKSDGTIYFTDPGYQGGAGVMNNHIWRIKPTTNDIVEILTDGLPNGIALSPDNLTLYVSFTGPAGGPPPPPPTIMKYPVNADGSLGAGTKFVDVTPNTSAADGLAIDVNGNVYVAVSNGVDVFKKDGTKWGHIMTTGKVINNVAFGGTDHKTLYMTSDTGLLSVVVKVAGLTN
jgi:gluconolactonase